MDAGPVKNHYRVATVGPSDESESKTSIIGETSHICAAVPGGQRFGLRQTRA